MRNRHTLANIALVAALIIVVLAALSINAALSHGAPCRTTACHHAERHRIHRRHVARDLRVIRPYRAWLARLGHCEADRSPHGYSLHAGLRAIGGGGAFRGRYQFTVQTWLAAGGHGDPAAASWLEQAYRAVLWRQRIGNPHQSAGWPVCG